MPDTPFLIAGAVVLAAVGFAVRTALRSGVRSGGRRISPAASRSALAETRSELVAARAEVDQLTERLRQAQARVTPTATVPVAHADGRHVEVFVNLSRRLQSLVHREIKLLDGLENEVEDPDLLKGLFQVDHLATRIRRHAENLAVLGGSVSRRQWSRPVALTEVLRSAIAEVEHYSRVKLVPPIDGTLPGHAVASVIHLIAELIENATMFAPPHTQVLLRAQQVAAGMAVEVEDRGLGMQRADLDRVNQLLVNPDDTNLDDLLRDGRIGLYVVSTIARQHGITVQLQANIFGGTQAVVILPPLLIGLSAPQAVAEAPLTQGKVSLTQADEPLQAQLRPPLERRVPLQKRVSTRPTPQVRGQSPSRGQDTTEITRPPAWPEVKPAHAAQRQVPGDAVVLAGAARGPAGPRPDTTATLAQQQVEATPSRPPLPRRRSQTHMAPQLQLGRPCPATEPIGEHHPGLMASFMNGVAQGEAGVPEAGNHD
ncbi:ATP-binding protein [Actinoplanes sp. NPDC051470]|uniref:sensor histidine kinase n=1 Tax=Actinoplanes sp. NPDC051470 TaxID=3157224 RepID=UPI0034445E66